MTDVHRKLAVELTGLSAQPDIAGPLLYTPEESSRLLNAEEIKPSWLKEQARRRKIPHCLVAGKYMFTAGHLVEIIQQFERPAVEDQEAMPALRRHAKSGDADLPRLTARPPRRGRAA